MIDLSNIKIGNQVVTKDGTYQVVNTLNLINPSTMKEELVILIDFDGKERKMINEDIIEVIS